MALNLARIIGTITGKVAFERTDDNFQAIQAEVNGHANNKNNPHAVTKTQVGLGNVDNTADSAKKVLSATKLTTARTINGVAFDGTKNIAVADSTKLPLAHNTDANAHGDIRQQINSLDADKADKAMGTRFTATLQNGWTGNLYYKKNDLGQVHLYSGSNGLTVGTVANGTVIAVLPEGFKPISATIPLLAYNISNTNKITGIDIFRSLGLVTYSFAGIPGQVVRIDVIYQEQ